MWGLHEDLKREAKSSGGDKKDKQRRINELRDKFASHSMHDLYVEHVRSDEGRAALHRLVEQWTNR